MRQEEKALDKLKDLKPSTDAPSCLHRKCVNVWKKQDESTQQIYYETKLWNENVIQVSKQADLDKKHWDQAKVSDEVHFRVKTLHPKREQIESINGKIDLSQDPIEYLQKCDNELKYKKNKASMVRTQSKNIIENVTNAEECIKQIKILTNEINNRMIKILQIKTLEHQPITCMFICKFSQT